MTCPTHEKYGGLVISVILVKKKKTPVKPVKAVPP